MKRKSRVILSMLLLLSMVFSFGSAENLTPAPEAAVEEAVAAPEIEEIAEPVAEEEVPADEDPEPAPTEAEPEVAEEETAPPPSEDITENPDDAQIMVNSVALSATEVALGADLEFTVKTPSSANFLAMYSENGSKVKTWSASGFSTVSGSIRTWVVTYAFGGAGERTMTFRCAESSTYGAGVSVSFTVTDASVTSVSVSPSTVDKGANATFTVKTPSSVNYIGMFTETDSKVKSWAASDYSTVSGSVRTWKVKYAFSSTGARTMTFKASANNSTFSGGKSVNLYVTPTITSASVSPSTTDKGKNFTFSVKTASSVQYLAMYSENGSRVKTWAASDYSTVSGSTRTWKVKYAFSGAGARTLTFKASIDNSHFGSGKNVSIYVTLPVLSASTDMEQQDINQPVPFTVTTDSTAQYLALYSESGSKVKTWSASGNSTVSGSTRTWNVSYAFSGAGDRTVTFKTSLDNSHYGSGKDVSVYITLVVKTGFCAEEQADVNQYVTFTITTSSSAQYLTMYSETGTLVKTWTSTNSKIENGSRVWTASYKFQTPGSRQMTFRTSLDNEHFGTGFVVSIYITPIVLSGTTSTPTIQKGEEASFSIRTEKNVKYIAMFAENGSKVKAWPASGNSTVSGNYRTWKVKYKFANAGDRMVTFRASLDNSHYGSGVTISVNVINATTPDVTMASFGAATAVVHESVPITVKTSENAKYVRMFAEDGTPVVTWSLSSATTSVANGIRTWSMSYAFNAEGNRLMTFRASADNSNYGTAKTAGIIITSPVDSGVLSGRVCEASSQSTPISGASITVLKNGSTVTTATSNSNGNYSFTLDAGSYVLRVRKSGYVDFICNVTVIANEQTYVETFLMIQGSSETTGTASGTIYNALTGSTLADVKLVFRSGWNNTSSSALKTLYSNSNGTYSVELPLGNYTVQMSLSGYITSSFNIIVNAGTTGNQNGSLTPVLDNSEYRIVLTWGENPRDIDSHVQGTLSSGSTFHVFYSHKDDYDGDVHVCNLDVDDTSSYGPETITLHPTTTKPYYYYVHHYAGSQTLQTSGATVKVYRGSTLLRTFAVPTTGTSDVKWSWNVFALVNGRIVVRNTITETPETSYAN